jgi:hypothetical protein
LVTGLGTLNFDDLGAALAARPAAMVSASPEQWELLSELYRGGVYRQEFQAAWQNGVAFLAATDGLRGRVPLVVEWRGSQRQPGDEPVPADLRIDHVFLISCKYLSHIVSNSSPSSVFDRLLAGGHGGRSADWYAEVAPDAYEALYRAVRDHLRSGSEIAAESAGTRSVLPQFRSEVDDDLPPSVLDLTTAQRAELQRQLGPGPWAASLRPAAAAFSQAVAEATATRWQRALADTDLERVLWRLLRMGSTPYFVLGAAKQGSLRLRIGTAWDWRQHFRIDDFSVVAAARAQPVVAWQVVVAHRRSTQRTTIDGHVEIRWSHGKFAQPPEAKVYLDTPHHRIPGYWPLT